MEPKVLLIYHPARIQNGASISFGKQTICILTDALGTVEIMLDHPGKLRQPVYASPRLEIIKSLV